MHIDQGGDPAEAARQSQAFDDRMLAELADHGALAGVAQGEAFKLLADL
jgi:hypothetical protein